MSATTTRKRRSAGSKAAQDKAQREAKAAEQAAEGTGSDEASEAELAAQVGRPSNETPAADDGAAEVETPAEDDDAPALGSFGALPKSGGTKAARPSKWTDRLNGVAEHQVAANDAEAERAKAAGEEPVEQWAFVHQTGTPATATSVASDVRKKLKEDRIGGLVGGGTFELKTRGRQIHARFIPKAD